MAFDAGCGVRLIQCTREVSPLSEWVRWRLFQERANRPVKELFSSDQHAKSFKDANRPIPLPHKASAKREHAHQEGSEYHQRMRPLPHGVRWPLNETERSIVMVGRKSDFLLVKCNVRHETFRMFRICRDLSKLRLRFTCFYFFVGSKTLSSVDPLFQ